MAIEAPARNPRTAMIVAVVLLGQAMSGAAAADEPAAAEPGTLKRLWLPQTRSDWDEIVAVARVNPARPANTAVDGLEEVVVTAPEDLLPMPGVYEQMWGGILTPFWAVLHPTQAWRIFLPIPPQ